MYFPFSVFSLYFSSLTSVYSQQLWIRWIKAYLFEKGLIWLLGENIYWMWKKMATFFTSGHKKWQR